MKKLTGILILALAATVLLAGTAMAQANDVKFTRSEFDIFGVSFERPDGWKPEVHANHIMIKDPANDKLQLVLLDVGKTDNNLEKFYNEYKDPEKNESLKEFKLQLVDSKATEVAGMGAYYLKFKSRDKNFGHILFIKNGHQYILALKTPAGELSKYEPILMKAAQTLRFYKANKVK